MTKQEKVYKSHDEVNAEEDSIPPLIKEETLEFGRQLREDGKCNQKENVWQAEENSCSRLPRLSNRRDADDGQIAMMQSKEVRQDIQSTKINMQMDKVHNATSEQRTKEFRCSEDGNQSERDEGLTGVMCKLFSQQSTPNVDIDVFDRSPLQFERKVVNLQGRWSHLINYTSGEVKESLKHCIQQLTEACYDNAKNLLMKQCGDPYKILLTY